MNTEIALSMDALALGRSGDHRTERFDAHDRKVIGCVVRALQRLLESDDVAPAHQEAAQRARIVVRDGQVLLLAALSTQAIVENDNCDAAREARAYRLPPLETKQPRTFAFG